MTGRHWFRKDVLLPIFYMLAFGAGLYYLRKELLKLPDLANSEFVRLALGLLLFIYVLLVLMTVRHVMSSYDLERYDPGDPASLKRLMRRGRFRLPNKEFQEEPILVAFEQALFQAHYHLEAESHLIGRIYRRHHALGLLGRPYNDRVIIMQHQPLNILLVDQLLQDSLRYLESQADKPSRRNFLLLVTRMGDDIEVASSAAGIVNFLGKFEGGTLCPLLFAVQQRRLFYPADRTLLPRSHRLFQDRLRIRLTRIIMGSRWRDQVVSVQEPGVREPAPAADSNTEDQAVS